MKMWIQRNRNWMKLVNRLWGPSVYLGFWCFGWTQSDEGHECGGFRGRWTNSRVHEIFSQGIVSHHNFQNIVCSDVYFGFERFPKTMSCCLLGTYISTNVLWCILVSQAMARQEKNTVSRSNSPHLFEPVLREPFGYRKSCYQKGGNTWKM